MCHRMNEVIVICYTIAQIRSNTSIIRHFNDSGNTFIMRPMYLCILSITLVYIRERLSDQTKCLKQNINKRYRIHLINRWREYIIFFSPHYLSEYKSRARNSSMTQ